MTHFVHQRLLFWFFLVSSRLATLPIPPSHCQMFEPMDAASELSNPACDCNFNAMNKWTKLSQSTSVAFPQSAGSQILKKKPSAFPYLQDSNLIWTYISWVDIYIYIYYYTYMTYIHINNMYNSLIIIYCILYKPETGWDAQTLMVMIDPPLLDPSLGDTRDSKDHGDSAQSTSWSNPGDPSLWWLSKTHEQTLCIRPPWHLVCLVVSVVRSDEVLWQETEVSSPRHQQSEDDLTKK